MDTSLKVFNIETRSKDMEDIFSQMGAILKGFTIMIIGMGKVF